MYHALGGSPRRRCHFDSLPSSLFVHSCVAIYRGFSFDTMCWIRLIIIPQINTWISGNLTAAVLKVTSWRWGIGMFAIIYPVCALPLIAVLFLVHRRAKSSGQLESYQSSMQLLGGRRLALELFWHLDVIGLILMIAMMALILVPFTIAGGVTAQWKTAKVIAPLVIGVFLVPVWAYWEKTCKHPMLPFKVSIISLSLLSNGRSNSMVSISKIGVFGVPSASPSCSIWVCQLSSIRKYS